MVIKKVVKIEYSFWKGVWKAIKTNAIIWVPAVIAFMASVPPKYTWIASVVIYFLKNLYEVKTGKKLL